MLAVLAASLLMLATGTGGAAANDPPPTDSGDGPAAETNPAEPPSVPVTKQDPAIKLKELNDTAVFAASLLMLATGTGGAAVGTNPAEPPSVPVTGQDPAINSGATLTDPDNDFAEELKELNDTVAELEERVAELEYESPDEELLEYSEEGEIISILAAHNIDKKNTFTRKVSSEYQEQKVLAVEDRFVGSEKDKLNVKGKLNKLIKRNQQFGVRVIDASECTDLNDTDVCATMKHCKFRCRWTKKPLSRAVAPGEEEGSYLYYVDTTWFNSMPGEGKQLVLCAEFSLTYSVRFARAFAVQQVIQRIDGRNMLRPECRWKSDADAIPWNPFYTDMHSNVWKMTTPDMHGIPNIPAAVIMAKEEDQKAREANATRKHSWIQTRQKGLVAAVGFGGGLAIGGIGLAVAVTGGGAAIGGVGAVVMTEVHAEAWTKFKGHVEQKLRMGVKSARASHILGDGSKLVHLRVQNVFLDNRDDHLSDTAVTCVWMGPGKCLGRNKDNKLTIEREDACLVTKETALGQLNCVFQREIIRDENGVRARLRVGGEPEDVKAQYLCRGPISKKKKGVQALMQLEAIANRDAIVKDHSCDWEILISTHDRFVMVVHQVTMAKGATNSWYTTSDTQHFLASLAELQMVEEVKQFVHRNTAQEMIFGPDTPFGAIVKQSIEERGGEAAPAVPAVPRRLADGDAAVEEEKMAETQTSQSTTYQRTLAVLVLLSTVVIWYF